MACGDGNIGDASGLENGSDPDADEETSPADTDASPAGTSSGDGTADGSQKSLAQLALGESQG